MENQTFRDLANFQDVNRKMPWFTAKAVAKLINLKWTEHDLYNLLVSQEIFDDVDTPNESFEMYFELCYDYTPRGLYEKEGVANTTYLICPHVLGIIYQCYADEFHKQQEQEIIDKGANGELSDQEV